HTFFPVHTKAHGAVQLTTEGTTCMFSGCEDVVADCSSLSNCERNKSTCKKWENCLILLLPRLLLSGSLYRKSSVSGGIDQNRFSP
ncbi:hypothetical protein J6590_063114, partial [Homalodisca vitripennis]